MERHGDPARYVVYYETRQLRTGRQVGPGQIQFDHKYSFSLGRQELAPNQPQLKHPGASGASWRQALFRETGGFSTLFEEAQQAIKRDVLANLQAACRWAQEEQKMDEFLWCWGNVGLAKERANDALASLNSAGSYNVRQILLPGHPEGTGVALISRVTPSSKHLASVQQHLSNPDEVFFIFCRVLSNLD